MGVAAGDERRHPGVAETWRFDAAAVDGPGVLVRLAFRPAERVAWWWIAAVGCGPALVALRAHDVAIPSRGTDIRTDGLWASVRCETPLEHWSVAVECFAVAYDDPWEALAGERGDVVPFGVELEWEAAAPASAGGHSGYGQWCTVTGEILLGDERIEVETPGYRDHAWGAAAELGGRSVRLPGVGDGPGGEVETVAVAPFAVPGGGWVERLCRAGDGAGWIGEPYTRS